MLSIYLLTFCQSAIGLVFAWSFIGKIRHVAAFREGIAAFKILPRRWSAGAALLFMAGELAVVLLIIAGGRRRLPAFLLAIVWLAIFSAALASVLGRNLPVSCNCFGAAERRVSRYDLVRNVGCILCSLTGAIIILANDQLPQALDAGGSALIALIGAIFVIVVVHVADIVEIYAQKPSIN